MPRQHERYHSIKPSIHFEWAWLMSRMAWCPLCPNYSHILYNQANSLCSAPFTLASFHAKCLLQQCCDNIPMRRIPNYVSLIAALQIQIYIYTVLYGGAILGWNKIWFCFHTLNSRFQHLLFAPFQIPPAVVFQCPFAHSCRSVGNTASGIIGEHDTLLWTAKLESQGLSLIPRTK